MKMIVNGVEMRVRKEELDLTLLDWLRERASLTGTKAGCKIGRCGSCTVLVGGRPKLACKISLPQVEGASITTIEGFGGPGDNLHPLQQSFVDHGAIQCGFCTPGMVLRAHAFLTRTPQPTREQIRRAISSNLCRCTGYQQIIDAIEAASPFYKKEAERTTHGKSKY